MILIWRGWGLLTIVTYLVVHLILSFLVVQFDMDIYLGFSSFEYLMLLSVVGGIANWMVGRRMNASRLDASGKEVKNRHGMFFLPMQYWSFAFAGLSMLLAAHLNQRVKKPDIAYYKERRELFEANEKQWLQYIDQPRVGDYYVLEFFPKGYDDSFTVASGKSWPVAKNYKALGMVGEKVRLLEPPGKTGFKYSSRKALEPISEGVSEENVRTHLVDKAVLRKTMARNFNKERTDYGVKITALNAGDNTVRLVGVYRFE